MSFLLDTDICIEILRGNPQIVEEIKKISPQNLAVSAITRYELCYGARRSAKSRKAEELNKVERFLSAIHLIPFTDITADIAATIRAELDQNGTPIGSMNLLIAATALENKLTVITNNIREFSRVSILNLKTFIK
jgi:tRNA(fMet)-specific endonuclease VapC